MQFVVPKFLERESIIAFGLTFKKLAVLGGLGLVLVVLYYITPRVVFITAAIVLGAGYLAAAFVKIHGVGIPEIVRHAFGFLFSGKIYIWGKKHQQTIQLVPRKKQEKGSHEKALLKFTPESHLSGISSKIEMGNLPR
ncbi:MAG: hypothetical protein M1127_01015 [Patescibacteria group bacterium]|nr:hypothetical protein [Patescibacteria group bacterium]